MPLAKTIPIRTTYKCSQCPGYCCTYALIPVTRRDVARLARHFGTTEEKAELRFTKVMDGEVGMRHKKDSVYTSTCMLFDQEKRCCSVYESRPSVCRSYPDGANCGYYNFLRFERGMQGDDAFVPDA